MTRWPLPNLPPTVYLDQTTFRGVPPRPGAVAEYEEERGSRRFVVVMRADGKLAYSYDEKRGQHLAFRL